MAELIKTDVKLCHSCKYSKLFHNKGNEVICDYLCMTYMRRGCPVGWCDKYEKRDKKVK